MKTFNAYAMLFVCLLVTERSFAEGTKQVSPNSPNLTALFIDGTVGNGAMGPYLGCPEDNRIYFRINDFNTERFYFGFMFTDYWSSGTRPKMTDMYIKIYNPSGTAVYGPSPLYANTNNLTSGYISTYDQAVAGPNGLDGTTTGYNAKTFTPTQNGEYWVEIYPSNDSGVTMLSGSSTWWRNAPFWDMGVSNTSSKKVLGRVHCDKWSFAAVNGTDYYAAYNSITEAATYCYTDDQVVLKLSFATGMMPLVYSLSMNNYGVTNSGKWEISRKSVSSGINPPDLTNGYKVFLNIPDPVCYPVSGPSLPPSLPNPAILKRGNNYQLKFNSPQPGDYIILFDFNGNDGAYSAGTTDRWIELPGLIAGINTYLWDGKDGLGNIIPKTQIVNLVIFFRKGRVNIPLYDVEMNLRGMQIDAVLPNNVPNARLYWDDTALISNSTCDGYNNITLAGWNNSVTGSVSPAHAWNGNGNLSQTIPAPANGGGDVTASQPCDDFGNVRTINTWAWGVELKANLNFQLQTIDLSGNVWNDVNNSANGTFSNISTAGESGTNIGGTLFATLVDPNDNTVIKSTAVSSNGAYTLTEIPMNANNLVLRLTSALGTEDAPTPDVATLTGWINTSPLTRNVSTATATITGLDFGVQQLPVATGSSTTISPIPTGTNTSTVSVALFSGSDSSGGSVVSLKITAIPTNATSITIDGLNYNTSNFPAGGVTVTTTSTGQPTKSIWVDPTGDVAVTVAIPFVVIDNGGAQSSNTAYVSLNFVPQADLQITKTASPTTPNVGNNVSFTLTAKNNGPNGATLVNVTDNTPSGYTLVSGSPTVGSWVSPTWTVGSLAGGTTATLTLVYTVSGTGTYTNTAAITGSETDTNTSNNVAVSTPVPVPFDFGDAPDSYNTLLTNNGARSNINTKLKIGMNVDGEPDGQPNATASGDGADEDGIPTIPSLIRTASTYSLTISVLNNTGSSKTLQGWIDFNRNTVFDDNEYASVSVADNSSQQTVTLTWSGLSGGVSGTSYIRLRLNDNMTKLAMDDIGVKGTGEVEDYTLCILPALPVSGGDKAACVTNPGQTLTATASVSSGETLVWYDAAIGGSAVATPTISSVGTVTYYAQANADIGGCSSASRTAVKLTIYPLPESTVTKTNVTCFNAANGSLTITVLVGTSPYTFSVDNGSTYPYSGTSPKTISNLSPGTFKIRVKDKYGCESLANP